ncbi:MAG: DUF418 domain-containing protein [Sphingomonadaceae bacterium]|nr:DUF418 domain-containing protein [Sphingomonadaceae bacterium]
MTSPLPRHMTLDAMRGFAVMGILAMNIIGFSMPEWAYVTPKAYSGETLADQVAWFFSAVFIDGKMRGLFSLLFGASMMLIIERAEAKGENAKRVHYARMAWLALFGLAHFFLIWFGDILFLYAAVGCIAFLFRHWEPRRLIKWALGIYALGILFWGLQFGGLQFLQYFASLPGADPELIKQYRDIMDNPDFAMNVEEELALHRGAWWPIVADKLSEWYTPLTLVLQSATETLPLMMIGMAMQKNGFITGAWNRADYARWVKRLVPVGLLLSALLAGWVAASGYDLITSLAVFLAWGAIPRLMLTTGYAALLIILMERLSGSRFITRVAAAGQAAFTNYLGTSIVMTTLFYGYGWGLYGFVGRAELWIFVIGMWAVMLLWSKPWLTRFRYGPLEWLWRSLARGSIQPIRR